MVLIEAKRMDEERRMRRMGGEGSGERSKPAELRWKWVEDYCWKYGCLRSQNQCNDKWDNLMRDFKKVREYERTTAAGEKGGGEDESKRSYWIIDKNERKDNNLPSNMLPEIYEALVEAVERKAQRSTAVAGGGNVAVPIPPQSPLAPSPVQQYPNNQPKHQQLILPLPPPPQELPNFQFPPNPSPTPPTKNAKKSSHHSDSETSEFSHSAAKRRKSSVDESSAAIAKSGAMIAEAIRSCEKRGERQHRESVTLNERRLRIEESNAEMNRQGMNGLVDAINKLANSILALASRSSSSSPK